MAFLKVKFWVRRLSPEGRYVFSVCLLLESGMAHPSISVPSDSSTGPDSLLPGEKTDSPKHKALSFSLWPVSQGGGQLGGSHIEKLGGAWGAL